MESVLDDRLAQFSSKNVLKEEQHQAVLGLLGQKDVLALLPARVLGKVNSPVVRAVKHKQKEKILVLVAS